MSLEILKLPQVLRDIEENFVYIAEDDLDAGIRFLVSVEDSFERLAEFPFIGEARYFERNDLTGLRFWPVKDFENYLIFYLVKETVIEVVRLLHTARDIEDIFNKR